MQRDWSGHQEVTEPGPLRRIAVGVTLVIVALALLSLGVWLGEARRTQVMKQSTLERPLTLGEARFIWRGSELTPLPERPTILPPIEDPIIPPSAPLPPTSQAPTLIPPTTPHQVKLSLTQSLAPNPVDHNALERAKVTQARAEQEQAERERVERERVEREQAEREQAEREQAEEQAEREKKAREQAEREQAEREKKAREQAEREQAEREQAEREKKAREQAEREQAEREKKAREQAEREQAKKREVRVRSVQNSDAQVASKGKLNLQVKAFRQRAEAIKFVRSISERLGEYQDQIYIQSAQSRGQPIYRVRIGPFKSELEADEARAEYMKRFGTQDAPFVSHR